MELSERIWRRMKLHDLHVLIAVVQTGSMSKAATLLNTTQPAISRSIAELEQNMGVRLLDRGRHGARPTEYGRALFSGGLSMFDSLRQALKHIEFLSDPSVGEISIIGHDPLLIGLLPAVVTKLHQTYPGISISVTPTVPDGERYRGLRERKFDLYLGRVTLIEEDISAETLFYDRVLVVAGPNSGWARRRKIELSELARASWLLPQRDTAIDPIIAEAFHKLGVSFPSKGAVWGPPSITSALLSKGPYLSVFPASLLDFGANLPDFRIVPVTLPVPPWPVGFMTLKNRTPSPAAQVFIACARELVKMSARQIKL